MVDFSVIKNSIIQSNSVIENLVLVNSMIGSNTVVKGKAADLSAGDYNVIEF